MSCYMSLQAHVWYLSGLGENRQTKWRLVHFELRIFAHSVSHKTCAYARSDTSCEHQALIRSLEGVRLRSCANSYDFAVEGTSE